MRKFAPLFTSRWWLLHLAAVTTVYAAGHLALGR